MTLIILLGALALLAAFAGIKQLFTKGVVKIENAEWL